MKNTILNWSGGKDCAMALHSLLLSKTYRPVKLVTTINREKSSVPMHEVHEALMAKQAESCGFQLVKLYLPGNTSNKVYEDIMENFWKNEKEAGHTAAAFGDIFLEDVRQYREKQLRKLDIEPVFPLWKADTKILIQVFFNLGFRAVITSADSRFFGNDIPGKELNEEFIRNLPDGVDPCGENGEFHTFVFDGPIFNRKVDFRKGKTGFTNYGTSGAWHVSLYPVD